MSPLFIARLVIVALAVAAGWAVASWRADAQIAGLKAQHAQALEQAARSATLAEQLARAEERRTTMKVKEIADADRAQLEARLRAATAAARAADRLRSAATSVARADQVARDPAAPERGQAAAGPGLVLADMLGSCSQRYAQLASAFDASRAAGLVCERAYDAVSTDPGLRASDMLERWALLLP